MPLELRGVGCIGGEHLRRYLAGLGHIQTSQLGFRALWEVLHHPHPSVLGPKQTVANRIEAFKL